MGILFTTKLVHMESCFFPVNDRKKKTNNNLFHEAKQVIM